MHPSANVQAQGTTECLKLQYYKIFSSNKQESGEVEEKTEIKPVLAYYYHMKHIAELVSRVSLANWHR